MPCNLQTPATTTFTHCSTKHENIIERILIELLIVFIMPSLWPCLLMLQRKRERAWIPTSLHPVSSPQAAAAAATTKTNACVEQNRRTVAKEPSFECTSGPPPPPLPIVLPAGLKTAVWPEGEAIERKRFVLILIPRREHVKVCPEKRHLLLLNA